MDYFNNIPENYILKFLPEENTPYLPVKNWIKIINIGNLK